MHMAALPFLLLATPIPWLLLLMPVMQVQPCPLRYPSGASAPTSWTNSPSLEQGENFASDPVLRVLLTSDERKLKGPGFAAGFYCVPPCHEFLFAVHTYFCFASVDNNGNIIPLFGAAQVIWAANRGRLVRENATLSLTTAGGLVLRDADGSVVWSAGTSGKAAARLKITESGNLMLVDDKNASVWQSFDHPTDCLVPGQTLAEGMMLTPSVSTTNFTANDQLHVTVRDTGFDASVGANPPQVYDIHWTTMYDSDKHQNGSKYIMFANGSIDFSYQPPDPYGQLIDLPPARSLQYMRFEPDGHLRLYEWQDWLQDWAMVRDILTLDACDYPTVCGKYGLCNNGQCSCPSETNASLAYFRPVDNERINLGCMPITPISCEFARDHRLVAFGNVSYFNHIDSQSALPHLVDVDEERCKQACLRNCSCKAALFFYGNSSIGSCLLPTELFSLKVLQQDIVDFNSSAFIKHNGWRKIYGEIDEEGDLWELPGMPTRFTFEQLKEATKQFREKLGHGGFGSVYMGQLREERVAVKCLDRSGQGKKEFLAEMHTIGGIHHINLVRLVGFCVEKSQRLLVYEYMSKGSLDRWIYYLNDNAPLGWSTRCRIITDIARGLCYLHEECRQKIAHLDVKPQNILLDDNFNAKLSDFGLAKLIDRDNSHVMTKMRGTPGYLAPEWLTSQITVKADIYSFGVVVMEVVSGRKNLDSSQNEENIHLISLLQDKARKNQLVDLIDKSSEDLQMHKEEVIGMMKLAMWCLQIDCNKRPRMSIVVKVLEGTVEVKTEIDYSFVATIPIKLGNIEEVGSSAPPLASQLSGPR
ncbi:hypothetical protein ACP70R_039149 [Stipagrostis hirtigluma subsp. patula]